GLPLRLLDDGGSGGAANFDRGSGQQHQPDILLPEEPFHLAAAQGDEKGQLEAFIAFRLPADNQGVLPSLVLFARAPLPGLVKTRLAARLTEEGAARLYHAFLEDAARAYVCEHEWDAILAA